MPKPTTHRTTCCYCGVGCGITIDQDRRGRLSLRGDPEHPSNQGLLCSKGRTLLHAIADRSERLLWPHLRSDRSARLRRASWDEAIDAVADGLRRVQRAHGPDAVALYVSGQCLTEEYYVANKLMKGYLGSNNIDTNSRLCMSSAVAGYKATLGADAPPCSYEDLDCADTFLIAGANPAFAHPIIFRRIEARKAADPEGVKVICIDPRRSATAAVSDLHLPLRPGTDVALFHGLAAQLRRTGQLDHTFIAKHTTGWAALGHELDQWPLERTAAVCGLPATDLVQAAAWLGGRRRLLSLWTMGLNQSAVGVDKNIALINLSLLTGKIGRPGCGPFSLTGQPNAMGGREVGGLANLLPAHRNLADPEDRAEVAQFWGVPALRPEPGLTAMEMLDALDDGRLKAIWVICTNPIHSWPDALRAERAFRKAELVVVQDCSQTDTTAFADILLPAATWLEKSGTMTNSERRITLLDKILDPPGEALPDAEILCRVARALGHGDAFAWPDEAAIFAEHAALTRGRDCDISGLSHARLKELRSTQWPVPDAGSSGTSRLYADHRFATADGLARLGAPGFHDRSEPVSAEFPLVLDTGRIRDQWHTRTRTGTVARLNATDPGPFVEIHPVDATPRGIRDGDLIDLGGARGAVRVPAKVTTDIRPGVVFVPMHWGGREGAGLGRINNACSTRFDPVSKEPDLKWAAVEAARHRPPPRHIVIVGGGAAALGLIEAHQRLADGGRVLDDRISVFGDEPEGIYDRVQLPHYVDGSKNWDDLLRATRDGLAAQQVSFHPRRRVVSIDRGARLVRDEQGAATAYDVLILATGSRPSRPDSGPLAQHVAMALRTRRDAELIRAAALAGLPKKTRVVIQGGGLLGIELADALAQLGCAVTIVQRSKRLMGRQLDASASSLLAEALLDRGIDIRFDAQLLGLDGEEAVSAVRLDDGTMLPCDLFVFATGTTANDGLARAAGLPCGAGISVDESLRTADPAIHAIGECAEWQGKRVGTTAGARAQAECLAEVLRGNPHRPWRGMIEANLLKVRGIALAACGLVDPAPEDGCDIILFHDPRAGIYRKAVLRGEKLVGVIMLGDTTGFAQHRDWIQSGIELEDLRGQLLRQGGAQAGPRGALICSCNQVGADDIADAIRSGCTELGALCAATRAGTGCGSCRPEVKKLIDRHALTLTTA